MNEHTDHSSGEQHARRAQEAGERAAEKVQDAAEKVRVVAEERVEQARRTVEEKADQLRGRAEDMRDRAEARYEEAKRDARGRADEGISSAASGLKDTAHRLREVAHDMDEKDRWLSATLERAASTVDRAGGYLSGNDLGDIVNDAQRFARRSPAAFMGGAAALGFVLSRIGKATAERAMDGMDTRSRGSNGSWGEASRPTSLHSADPARPVGAVHDSASRPVTAARPAGVDTDSTETTVYGRTA